MGLEHSGSIRGKSLNPDAVRQNSGSVFRGSVEQADDGLFARLMRQTDRQ